MMLVNASSTARVMERQSEAEKPNTSVKRSSAPRTTQSSLGSLCRCSFNSTPSLAIGTPSPSGCREGITGFTCEGGFAVTRALAFRATEFPELRFQAPQLRGWLTARGRIVWMSENKAVAAIQFVELPEASRLETRKWASAEEEGEHAEAEQRGTMEPRTIVSETAYRGDPRDRGGAAPMEAAANTTQAAPRSETVASRHHIAAHMPPAAVPAVHRATASADAAEAPPSQDFRFNEDSMFAAQPGR